MMLERLTDWDSDLLLFLNHLNNPVLDFVMYWASNKWIWITLYVLLAGFIYKRKPSQLILILLFAGLMILISDQVASTVIKNWVMRFRPTHDPRIASQVHIVNGYAGGEYGFVSSHASNCFALLTYIAFLFPREKKMLWILIAWCLLVSYSRVYLGVHFPGDVICGALLGFLIGWLAARGFGYYENHEKSNLEKKISR